MLESRVTALPGPQAVPSAPRRFRPTWPTVLVAADDPAQRRRYVDELRADGYTVHVADGAATAMVLLGDLDPSLTIIELVPLERMKLIDSLMHLDPDSPVFVADHDEDIRTAVAALRRRDEELPPAV